MIVKIAHPELTALQDKPSITAARRKQSSANQGNNAVRTTDKKFNKINIAAHHRRNIANQVNHAVRTISTNQLNMTGIARHRPNTANQVNRVVHTMIRGNAIHSNAAIAINHMIAVAQADMVAMVWDVP